MMLVAVLLEPSDPSGLTVEVVVRTSFAAMVRFSARVQGLSRHGADRLQQ
jgi:hypothetical protein